MVGPLKSKQGCWTCRLRRKKCDERHDVCSICESLLITCYGYGPKPDWMDNGDRERAMAISLRDIVKHTSRRKPTGLTRTRELNPIWPALSTAPSRDTSNLVSDSSRNALTDEPRREFEKGTTDTSGWTSASQAPHGGVPNSSFSGVFQTDKYGLMMHFLDHVFPLQYPMYKPGVLIGGRGWLMSLLLTNEHFYHASLATSAYDRRIRVSEIVHEPCKLAFYVEQEELLGRCITALSQAPQNICPGQGPGVVITIVQLVFYELFKGDHRLWWTHLRGAQEIYIRGYRNKFTTLTTSPESSEILSEDLIIETSDIKINEEALALRFAGGTIIWLDIISSVTAGTSPHLLELHSTFFTPQCQTKLEHIMGCENWVMLQLGRIAALHDRKVRAQEEHSANEFEQEATSIGQEMLNPATLSAFRELGLVESDFATKVNAELEAEFNTQKSFSFTEHGIILNEVAIVTASFAYMAIIYMHLVTYGFRNLDVLDPVIVKATRIFQQQATKELLPALVAPLFMFGCVLNEKDQSYFRGTLSSYPLQQSLLKHREKMRDVLEDVWAQRKTTTDFTWKDVVDLSHDILLI